METKVERPYPAFDGGQERLDGMFQAREKPVRDDLDLCFLCLRWTSGDVDCRNGVRCDMQVKLDLLEHRLEKPS